MAEELRIVQDATCTFCGCVCDDMVLSVDDEHHKITKSENACVLGKAWFKEHGIEDRPPALIDGRPATTAEGVEEAAQILAKARFPIIYGLSDTTCEAQRVAVGIGDMIGGTVDTTTSVCHGPTGIAFQGVGETTASLGEVKNRADLVIFWGGNPAEAHPRLFARYAVTAKGMYTPNGKKDRTVVLVDVRRTPSTPVADIFIQVKPKTDFEVLWALRALIKGTRFVLLKNPWNLTPRQKQQLHALVRANSPLSRAWYLKEDFQRFFDYLREGWARKHLDHWLRWAARSRLAPFKKLARLVRTHRDGILAWTKIRVTNGALEGMNNKVKLVSHRAFGFRNVEHYKTAIYHCCADLPA